MDPNIKLENVIIGLMVGVALFFDAFQFLINLIPIAGQILASGVELVVMGIFYFWFKSYDISFATPKRAAIMGSSFILELIPILNALPAITLAVLLVALDARIKDFVKPPPPVNTKTPRTFPENEGGPEAEAHVPPMRFK